MIKKLKLVLQIMKTERVQFALAGGLATSVYRFQKRTTDDLDFLIYSDEHSESTARKILNDLGYSVSEARKANLEGGPQHSLKRKTTPLCILVGRKEGEIGLDFILPNMPWFRSAFDRAQSNVIDFGIAKIPCLTVEDIILSKFYSLQNNSSRFMDADDLKSVFEKTHKLDLAYLTGQMRALEFMVPLSVEKFAPPILLTTSKNIRKSIRTRLTRKSKS